MRVLIVEDDLDLQCALARWFRPSAAEVRLVGTVRDGLAALDWHPDVIILDIALPDGRGVEIAKAAVRLRPLPKIVVTSGSATSLESFRLARLHVQLYLLKPYDVSALESAVTEDTSTEQLELASAYSVGRMGLLEARDLLRRTMVEQAVALSNGNLTHAAGLLGVTRQAVQAAIGHVRTESCSVLTHEMGDADT